MGRITIINCSTVLDKYAVKLVYDHMCGKRTDPFNKLGIMIKHQTNSRTYRVIDKES